MIIRTKNTYQTVYWLKLESNDGRILKSKVIFTMKIVKGNFRRYEKNIGTYDIINFNLKL